MQKLTLGPIFQFATPYTTSVEDALTCWDRLLAQNKLLIVAGYAALTTHLVTWYLNLWGDNGRLYIVCSNVGLVHTPQLKP
jgi:hypothetical protein